MQRVKVLMLIILIMLSCSLGYANTVKTVKIASWNIRDFSSKNFDPEEAENLRDLEHVVDILKDYQVIAIQEVIDHKIIQRTLDLLKTKGFNYSAQTTEKKVGTGNFQEHYAFLYDTDKIKVSEGGEGKVYSGEKEDVLERDPYYATFEVKGGGFDFTLVTFHAVSEGQKLTNEVEALATVFTQIQNRDDENDIILLGDFNFDPALDTGHYPHKGAYNPLLEKTKMVLQPPLKSLVSGNGLVDNMFFEEKFTQEYINIYGVTAFDTKVSDHFLIWAEFKVPLEDDD